MKCLSCQKFSQKVKYFLTVHYFVVIMSTFPYCAYIYTFIYIYIYICYIFIYLILYIYIHNIYIYI